MVTNVNFHKNKMGRDLTTHNDALDYLVTHLNVIDIDRKSISWMLKEPKIFHGDSMFEVKSCDLVLGFNEPYNHSYEVELKRSRRSRGCAKIQMRSTSDNFCDKIKFPVVKKYIVYYPVFDYEVVK